MIQVLVTHEHNDPRVKVSDTPYIAGAGEKSLTFTGDTIPESFAPNCYLVSECNAIFARIYSDPVFAHHHITPNPHLYLAKQEQVFSWAKENIHNAEYLAYGLHGHQQKAKIFHAFAVMNVMAAMHKVNILGEHWYKVQGNISIGWREFVNNISIAHWTQEPGRGGVNFNQLVKALGGFVTLNNVWEPVQDWNNSGWALFNREYGGDGLTAAPDIRRATNIVVIPPNVIPAWTYSSIEPLEPLFTWGTVDYLEYLKSISVIIPVT